MAIARKSALQAIEVHRDTVTKDFLGYRIVLALFIEDDGVEDSDTVKWHRAMVYNSDQVQATMDAVNLDITTRLKAAPLPQAQINRLKQVILAIEGVIGFKEPPPLPTLPGQ